MNDKAAPDGDARSPSAAGLEPAIPAHLRVPRTMPLNAPPGFTPVHPSYSARFHRDVVNLTIAYYGVQNPCNEPADDTALEHITTMLAHPDGPLYWDIASHVDHCGFRNRVVAAYWRDDSANRRWEERLGSDWWYRLVDSAGPTGTFREVFRPSVRDTETTFSHRHAEGFARVADAMSGETDTHEYWGSARDRIPRAQTDALAPEGRPASTSASTEGESQDHLVIMRPHENLCLLRSGQDWSETEGAERDFYLSHVKPYLDAGMEELNEDGLALGCYFNRYLLLESGNNSERSYSLSAWHSLAALEAWVKAETHLKIWAAGIKHYKRANTTARLRLYHELVVLRAEDQSFAYFNCHQRTGMLNATPIGRHSERE